MTETHFILSPTISRSFNKGVHRTFLCKYRLYAEYVRSARPFHEFVQDQIAIGKLVPSDLEIFLEEDLMYGNQRSISVYELYGDYSGIQNTKSFLECIQERYAYIDSLKFHNLLSQPYREDMSDLVSVSINIGLDGKTIQRASLIFSEKCTVIAQGGFYSEYSYVTVILDFVEGNLCVKVAPKERVQEEEKKPSALANKYFHIVTTLFDLKYNDLGLLHKMTLCNLNSDLYNQVYNKVVHKQSDKIKEYIASVKEGFLKELDIKNYKEKLSQNSIFDIEDMLTKMVEHILITDILYETAGQGTSDGIEGYVTYIKFSDGTNISAKIRGENYVEPIFSSEAFMALRAAINNAKKITVLKVTWLDTYQGTRVSYDATNGQCLGIHFYKHHTKEEYEYALRKYRECEERTIDQNPTSFAMEA